MKTSSQDTCTLLLTLHHMSTLLPSLQMRVQEYGVQEYYIQEYILCAEQLCTQDSCTGVLYNIVHLAVHEYSPPAPLDGARVRDRPWPRDWFEGPDQLEELKYKYNKIYKSWAIYQLCQSMPGTSQGQAGTSRDKQEQAGTNRDKAGTRRDKAGTNRDKQEQTGTVPVCP